MAIELWWGSGSGPAWRVMLALQHKGLAWTSHLISFSKRETRTPEFLALNPRGKVPVLRADGLVLNESIAILAFLDAAHPERPLFGTSPAQTGEVWRAVMEYESHGSPTIGAVSRPILFEDAAAKADTIRAAVPALEAELDRFASSLSPTGHLVGDTISAADLVWYAGFGGLVRALTRPQAAALQLGLFPLGGRWPAIARFAANVEAIDGFASTVPPHWLEGDAPYPGTIA